MPDWMHEAMIMRMHEQARFDHPIAVENRAIYEHGLYSPSGTFWTTVDSLALARYGRTPKAVVRDALVFDFASRREAMKFKLKYG